MWGQPGIPICPPLIAKVVSADLTSGWLCPFSRRVTTSQEGTLKGGLGLPLPFSNPSRFDSPMSPMSPLALGQALERVNSLCASHFLTLRFFADES